VDRWQQWNREPRQSQFFALADMRLQSALLKIAAKLESGN
jgi:hypothetical protein